MSRPCSSWQSSIIQDSSCFKSDEYQSYELFLLLVQEGRGERRVQIVATVVKFYMLVPRY